MREEEEFTTNHTKDTKVDRRAKGRKTAALMRGVAPRSHIAPLRGSSAPKGRDMGARGNAPHPLSQSVGSLPKGRWRGKPAGRKSRRRALRGGCLRGTAVGLRSGWPAARPRDGGGVEAEGGARRSAPFRPGVEDRDGRVGAGGHGRGD